MNDEIRVHVADYGSHRNLMMRYRDPITGKHVAKTTGTRNERAAERAAAKWESELREGRYKAQSKMAWEEFKNRYEFEVLPGLADGTESNKCTVLNHVERIINPQRIAEMTTNRLSAFVGALRSEGMKETTLAGHLAHLKPILQWAVLQGYLRIMPAIPKVKRAKGVTKFMRGRPITGEELDRMIDKVPEKRKQEPEKWQRLLRGLWLSGLRLSEALMLSWDEDSLISVRMDAKYPALRVFAEGEKGHKDRLLPLSPEFAEFLHAVPQAERHGLVFGIYGQKARPLSEKRASRYISSFGKAANVVTNKSAGEYASAQDLRRTFGTRWAKKVMPAVLQQLMRHSSIKTTMTYYVDIDAEEVGDLLRAGIGNTAGNTAHVESEAVRIDSDANVVKIRS